MSEPHQAPPPVQVRRAGELGLPEVTWTFRRIYCWALTVVLLGLVAYIVHLLADQAGSLERLAYCLLAILVVVILLYVGGANMTDLRRLAVVRAGPWFSLGRPDADRRDGEPPK